MKGYRLEFVAVVILAVNQCYCLTENQTTASVLSSSSNLQQTSFSSTTQDNLQTTVTAIVSNGVKQSEPTNNGTTTNTHLTGTTPTVMKPSRKPVTSPTNQSQHISKNTTGFTVLILNLQSTMSSSVNLNTGSFDSTSVAIQPTTGNPNNPSSTLLATKDLQLLSTPFALKGSKSTSSFEFSTIDTKTSDANVLNTMEISVTSIMPPIQSLLSKEMNYMQSKTLPSSSTNSANFHLAISSLTAEYRTSHVTSSTSINEPFVQASSQSSTQLRNDLDPSNLQTPTTINFSTYSKFASSVVKTIDPLSSIYPNLGNFKTSAIASDNVTSATKATETITEGSTDIFRSETKLNTMKTLESSDSVVSTISNPTKPSLGTTRVIVKTTIQPTKMVAPSIFVSSDVTPSSLLQGSNTMEVNTASSNIVTDTSTEQIQASKPGSKHNSTPRFITSGAFVNTFSDLTSVLETSTRIFHSEIYSQNEQTTSFLSASLNHIIQPSMPSDILTDHQATTANLDSTTNTFNNTMPTVSSSTINVSQISQPSPMYTSPVIVSATMNVKPVIYSISPVPFSNNINVRPSTTTINLMSSSATTNIHSLMQTTQITLEMSNSKTTATSKMQDSNVETPYLQTTTQEHGQYQTTMIETSLQATSFTTKDQSAYATLPIRQSGMAIPSLITSSVQLESSFTMESSHSITNTQRQQSTSAIHTLQPTTRSTIMQSESATQTTIRQESASSIKSFQPTTYTNKQQSASTALGKTTQAIILQSESALPSLQPTSSRNEPSSALTGSQTTMSLIQHSISANTNLQSTTWVASLHISSSNAIHQSTAALTPTPTSQKSSPVLHSSQSTTNVGQSASTATNLQSIATATTELFTQAVKTSLQPTKPLSTQTTMTSLQSTKQQTTQAMTTSSQSTKQQTTQAMATSLQSTEQQTTQAMTTSSQSTKQQTTQSMTTSSQSTEQQTTQAMATSLQPTKPLSTQAMMTTSQPTQPVSTQAMMTTSQPTRQPTTQKQTSASPTILTTRRPTTPKITQPQPPAQTTMPGPCKPPFIVLLGTCRKPCDKKTISCGENGKCHVDTNGITSCICNKDDSLFEYEGDKCETKKMKSQYVITIAAGSGGGIILIILFVVCGCWCWRRSHDRKYVEWDSLQDYRVTTRNVKYIDGYKTDGTFGKGRDNPAYYSEDEIIDTTKQDITIPVENVIPSDKQTLKDPYMYENNSFLYSDIWKPRSLRLKPEES